MSGLDWTNVGATVVPEQMRSKFTAAMRRSEWVTPNGQHPMSPALGLEQVIREFGIRPVTAVSYAAVFNGRYTVLGVRTRRQAIYFLDKGASITPVCVETLDAPADLIEAA